MNQEQREISAQNLLANPLFIEAFSVVEEELLTLWKTTGSIDIDQREAFWLALRLLERLKSTRSDTWSYGLR